MRFSLCPVTTLILAGSLLVSGRSVAQEPKTVKPPSPSFWQAAGGLVAINGLTWFYNWHVQRWHWANVGTRAWWKNLRDGFIWDDDAFMDNQLAHPYHGSLYFNAARGSGYGFWESTAFAMAGSITWELLTENVRPSLNDLINTTLGGIALGEVTFRLSSLLVGNGTRGLGLGRQAAAFVLNPIGRTQTLLNGKARPEMPGHSPASTREAWISVGRRMGTDFVTSSPTQPRAFVGLSFLYGSPFATGPVRPYDAFEFSLQLSPNDRDVVNQVAVSGLLARRVLRRSAKSQLLLSIYQHYDYEQLPTFRASSQSLGGGVLFNRKLGSGKTDLSFALELEGIPLGAVSSDHNGVRNRDYDYGVGGGARFNGSLRHSGRNLLRLDARAVWIHSLYGAEADHIATTAQLSAMVPLLREVGVGGDVGLTFRRSLYRDQPRVLKRIPQVRAYLVWSPS